ncbi:MAG: single-stranded-DNA-specific exonuclease RecJ [Chloroflexi bacterium]|nr:single-stranded-DNA-specific exonuclease RecJ [Chloroflexota bacterium]
MNRSHRSSRVWRNPQPQNIPERIRKSFFLPELVLQALFNRGIQTEKDIEVFLDFHKYKPSSPYEFKDMEKAIKRTMKAIRENELIGIWGDFDVDGQTSTAVLVSTLRFLGAKVIYKIPIRAHDSHGIKLESLKIFLNKGVNLVITCDTGISAHESISYAQSKNVDVIITDHHVLPEIIPNAFAVINPHEFPSSHPLRPLPGVGTAYKFAEALLTVFQRPEFSDSLHDLAALGIVADLAEVRGEARFLVQSGIEKIQRSSRSSIRAMLDDAAIPPQQLTEQHLSYSIAPKLNAIGRLSDANPIVDFLLTKDPSILRVTSNLLEGFNAQRKLLCDQVFQGALDQIDRSPSLLDHSILMLFHPEWPAGVVGIVASRLTALFHRPTILFVTPEGGIIRGSARSIEGIDITTALSEHQDLLISFGGHPMAAGLSLNPDQFKQFQRELNLTIRKLETVHPSVPELVIDAFLDPSAISFEMLHAIETLAPFGPGNPQLTFASQNLHITSSRKIGKTRDHLQLAVEDPQGNGSEIIWWQGADFPQPEGIFDLAFSARSTHFKGMPQIQLEWIDFRSLEKSIIDIHAMNPSRLQLHDYRTSKFPEFDLQKIRDEFHPLIWKEGSDFSTITGFSRETIPACKNLVLWTIPPCQLVLDSLIHQTQAKQIFCFGTIPFENDPSFFLERVIRMIKESLITNGPGIDADLFASKTAMTGSSIRLVLRWLAARGDIFILSESKNIFELQINKNEKAKNEKGNKIKLQKSIDEIRSYRAFYLRIALNNLLQAQDK